MAKTNYMYQINLPAYTDKKVIEWFENHSESDRLSEEIIALVFEHVYSIEGNTTKPNIIEEPKSKIVGTNSTIAEEDFLANLYNWQDSNNMIHSDDIKREKKRMLSV